MVGAFEGVNRMHTSFESLFDTLSRSNDNVMIGYIQRFDSKATMNLQDDESFGTRG